MRQQGSKHCHIAGLSHLPVPTVVGRRTTWLPALQETQLTLQFPQDGLSHCPPFCRRPLASWTCPVPPPRHPGPPSGTLSSPPWASWETFMHQRFILKQNQENN